MKKLKFKQIDFAKAEEVSQEIKEVLAKHGYATNILFVASADPRKGTNGFICAIDNTKDVEAVTEFAAAINGVAEAFVAATAANTLKECDCAECRAKRSIEDALLFSKQKPELLN